MTDTQSKDYTEMLEGLYNRYGCFGIKTMSGLSIWVDQWIENTGDRSGTLLDDCLMMVDTDKDLFTMWSIKEVIDNG